MQQFAKPSNSIQNWHFLAKLVIGFNGWMVRALESPPGRPQIESRWNQELFFWFQKLFHGSWILQKSYSRISGFLFHQIRFPAQSRSRTKRIATFYTISICATIKTRGFSLKKSNVLWWKMATLWDYCLFLQAEAVCVWTTCYMSFSKAL